MTTLHKYFKLCKKECYNIVLPDPSGSLSKELDSAVIKEANKEVSQFVTNTGGKRAPYLKVTPQQKVTVAKYVVEHGIVNAICHFKKDFPEDSLKECTIHGWKKAYLLELQSRRRAGKDLAVKELPNKEID